MKNQPTENPLKKYENLRAYGFKKSLPGLILNLYNLSVRLNRHYA